jgi:hypothetical protein
MVGFDAFGNEKTVIDIKKEWKKFGLYRRTQATMHIILMQSISVAFQVDDSSVSFFSVYLARITFVCRSVQYKRLCTVARSAYIYFLCHLQLKSSVG